MAVFARIEIEEFRLNVIRAQHKEIVLAFDHDLRTLEVSTLSLSLQVAYLGIVVRFADECDGIKDDAYELLCEVRKLSTDCDEMLKLMRKASNGFQTKDSKHRFVWNDQHKCMVESLNNKFQKCYDSALNIYYKLHGLCPHPVEALEKIKDKVAKIVAKSTNATNYFSVENYINHIQVSRELNKITQLKLAMITISALGSFITGISHITQTLTAFVTIFQKDCKSIDDHKNNTFARIQNEITLVIIATATAVFFESISVSINELNIFIGDQYNNEKATESLHHIMILFMKSVKWPKNEKEAMSHKFATFKAVTDGSSTDTSSNSDHDSDNDNYDGASLIF